MNLSDSIERLKRLDFVPILEAEIQRGIRERTAKGVDAAGNSFAPYVPAYAKVRARKGLRVSPVNLRVKAESSLLDSMESSRESQAMNASSEIGFSSEKDGQVKGLMSKREFLGINPADIARAENKFNAEFERVMK